MAKPQSSFLLVVSIMLLVLSQALAIQNGREVARKLIGNNDFIQLCSCEGKSDNCAFCGLQCYVSSNPKCPTCPLVYQCDKKK